MKLGGYSTNNPHRRKGFAAYYDVVHAARQLADKPALIPAAVIAVSGSGTNAERVNAIKELSASGRGVKNANLNNLTLDGDLIGDWRGAEAHNFVVKGKTKADLSGASIDATFHGGIAGSAFDGAKGKITARDQDAQGVSMRGFGGTIDVAHSDISDSTIKAIGIFNNFNGATANGATIDVESVMSDYDNMKASSGNLSFKSDFMGSIKYSRFGKNTTVRAEGMDKSGMVLEKGATVFAGTLENADNSTIEDGVVEVTGLASTAELTRQKASPLFAFKDKKLRPQGFAVPF